MKKNSVVLWVMKQQGKYTIIGRPNTYHETNNTLINNIYLRRYHIFANNPSFILKQQAIN